MEHPCTFRLAPPAGHLAPLVGSAAHALPANNPREWPANGQPMHCRVLLPGLVHSKPYTICQALHARWSTSDHKGVSMPPNRCLVCSQSACCEGRHANINARFVSRPSQSSFPPDAPHKLRLHLAKVKMAVDVYKSSSVMVVCVWHQDVSGITSRYNFDLRIAIDFSYQIATLPVLPVASRIDTGSMLA